MSADQFGYRPCGGAIAWTDRPQEIAGRNPHRCGGYVSNNSNRVMHLFIGEAVELQPFRAVLLGDYCGPVRVSGFYDDRYSAVEFTRNATP